MKRTFSLLLVLVMLLGLTACGKDKTAQEAGGSKTDTPQNEAPANPDPEPPAVTEKPEGPMFWYNLQDWSNIPKGSFDGTLFSVDMPIPIDMNNIDAYCAPYHWEVEYEDSGDAETLSEILTSSDIYMNGRHNTCVITPAEFSHEENFAENGFKGIYILCPEDTPKKTDVSVKECYEQGLWYIDIWPNSLLLGDYGTHSGPCAVGDALIDLFGKPSYCLYYTHEAQRLSTNDGGDSGLTPLQYYMIYEHEQYTLEIQVMDNTQSELSIFSCTYYPAEYWQQCNIYEQFSTGVLTKMPQ